MDQRDLRLVVLEEVNLGQGDEIASIFLGFDRKQIEER